MPGADKQWQAVKEKILLSRKTSLMLPRTTLLPERKKILKEKTSSPSCYLTDPHISTLKKVGKFLSGEIGRM